MITRFPPSPTGFLHVGSLRTALFAYLASRKAGGKFILRIEDTDRERLVDGATLNIVETLQWAGITIDEGVTLDAHKKLTEIGDNGPYIQSDRKEAGIYQKYIQILIDKGDAYYAFDTPEELDKMRELQETLKRAPRYDRMKMKNQLTLSAEEVQQRLASGEKYVVRLKMPETGVTIVNDLVRGQIEFKNELIDDQILLKSDGFPTYHFAVVVDDHLMGVTHVIRAEEWVSSIPKHITIYNAFGWSLPVFAHLSLLVNEQKQKLSKRHGDVAVEDFKQKGYLPEAMINFVAFLGWNPGTEQEIFSLKELEQTFSLDKVGVSPSVFDYVKLDWYNKQYIMAMNPTELAKRCIPFFKNAGVLDKNEIDEPEELERLAKIVALEQGRASTLKGIVEETGFIFSDDLVYEADLLVWKKATKEDAKTKLEEVSAFLTSEYTSAWERTALEEGTLAWIAAKGYGNGDVLWPLRVSLSGKKNSPGPLEIAAVLGKEKTLARIATAITQLTA